MAVNNPDWKDIVIRAKPAARTTSNPISGSSGADRYPTPAQVRTVVADSSMLYAREVFFKTIDPKLADRDNYGVDQQHGRAYISFTIPMTFTDDFLQKVQTVVTQEFIATRPGWRIACFESHVSPADGFDDTVHDYTKIIFEEDIAHT